MKSNSKIFLIIIFIIFGIIIFIIIFILTKIEVREIFILPKYAREAYLDISFTYSDFSNLSFDYSYMFYIRSNFQHDLDLNIISKFIISNKNKEIVIDEKNIKDTLASNVKKRYDIDFKKIFDDSKINNLNFCEEERNPIFGCKYECCKGDSIADGICWEDCKIYKISSFDSKKNLYCRANPKIVTIIEYNAIVNGTVELNRYSTEEKIRWSVRNSPLNIYLRPSPLPFNNLLPLDITFEIDGNEVFLKKIKVEVINYSVEIETFFEKKVESLEVSQKCEIEINRFINGKVYLGKEKSCSFGPFEIKIQKISKNRFETSYVNREEINKIIKSVCKDYIVNESIDYENCAKELNKKGYDLCKLYSDLEICKIGEEKINKIIFFITAEFERKEEYQKKLIPTFC